MLIMPAQSLLTYGKWHVHDKLIWSGRDKRDTQKLIENLMQHTAKRVGPMAARKLIGLLTSEDPLQAMDDFAKA